MRTLVFLACLVAPMAVAYPTPPQPNPAEAAWLRPSLVDALGFLEPPGDRELSPGLAAYAAEAAVAAGPIDGAPLTDAARRALVVPTDGALMPRLRPAHAAALLGGNLSADGTAAGILAFHDGDQFGSRAALNDDIWAILALTAGAHGARWTTQPGADLVRVAAQNLLANATDAGGWGWAGGAEPEVDTTGMALLALQRTGRMSALDDAQRTGIAALLEAARDGEGFALAAGGPANCDSTVWAIRIHDALGLAPNVQAWTFLLSLQGDDGGFAWRAGDAANAVCTAEAAALLGDAVAGRIAAPAAPAAGAQKGDDGHGVPAPGWMVVALVVGAVAAARARGR